MEMPVKPKHGHIPTIREDLEREVKDQPCTAQERVQCDTSGEKLCIVWGDYGR